MGIAYFEGPGSMIPDWMLLVTPFIGIAAVLFALWVANRIDPLIVHKKGRR